MRFDTEFSGQKLSSLLCKLCPILQHVGNCQYEIVWCENKCGAKLERRFLTNHMRNECHKRTVKCPYCSKEFVYETLQVCLDFCSLLKIFCFLMGWLILSACLCVKILIQIHSVLKMSFSPT